MKTNFRTRYAASPKDVKNYDTTRLREEFLVNNLMIPNVINLVYSHYDRFITGSAVPTNESLKLKTINPLKSENFLDRRELGIINVGEKGTVIVDVSIDQGGCFETSQVTNHKSPTYTKHGVIHYCVPNIASSVSRTASFALSNIFSPLLMEIGKEGGIARKVREDIGFRHGVYVYKGTLTSKTLGDAFNLPFKNIDLLLMAL